MRRILVAEEELALALTMDPPEEYVMKRSPRNPNEGILQRRLASILATFLTQFLGTAVRGGSISYRYSDH